MKFDIKALAVAGGVIWGCIVFLITLWLIVRNLHTEPMIFELIYPGYSVSGLGSLVGLAYGFVDGAVVGLAFGWLYNSFISKDSMPGKKA